MEGQRSSLVLEAIRLISECRPSVFVWENVKGTFSSNDGADFWAIIQAFANIGGYRLEWQLLNTSWFLPQNRERIYLVGYSTTSSGGGVFPIGESNRKANELQGEQIQSNTILAGYHHANGTYIGERELTPQVKQIGTRLDSNGGTQPYQQDRVYDADGIVPALNQGKSDLIIKESVVESNFTIGDIRYDAGGFRPRDNGVAPALTNFSYNSCSILRDNNTFRIRRLTPIECERLQGFPDQHTAYGNYDGEVKPMSNTQRYKQCGNAVTVDVVAAVAKKCLPLFN